MFYTPPCTVILLHDKASKNRTGWDLVAIQDSRKSIYRSFIAASLNYCPIYWSVHVIFKLCLTFLAVLRCYNNNFIHIYVCVCVVFNFDFLCVQYMYLDLDIVMNDRHVNSSLHKYVHLVMFIVQMSLCWAKPQSSKFLRGSVKEGSVDTAWIG